MIIHGDAKFLHDAKIGRKIENEKVENIWINPDLTRTEREAAFEKKIKNGGERNERKKNTKRTLKMMLLKIKIAMENISI